MHITAVIGDLTQNSVGRAYSLWLLVQHLGWEMHVWGRASGNIWRPIRNSRFARQSLHVVGGRPSRRPLPISPEADVVIAIKAMPEPFSVARDLASRMQIPMLVDADDPDLEAAIERVGLGQGGSFSSPHRLLRGRHPRQLRNLRHEVVRFPLQASNPTLAELYGTNHVVPHVRRPRKRSAVQRGKPLTIAFIGTNRPHKGLHTVREAVARLEPHRFRLIITDSAPKDAKSYEQWIGQVDLEQALRVLDGAHIAVVPSLPSGYGRAQLPVKVIDAMMAGKAVLASDLAPIRWALGTSGILLPPGDTDAWTAALLDMRDANRRLELGERSRERALRLFTPDAVAGAFQASVARLLK